MRRIRLAIHAALVLALLSGCYNVVYPNQPKPVHPDGDAAMWPSNRPDPTPLVYDDIDLCLLAMDAASAIRRELSTASESDAARAAQTVKSYRGYAVRLREIAGKTTVEARRTVILKAADAADKYAREVERRKTYKGVDIEPAIRASEAAFPGCDLESPR